MRPDNFKEHAHFAGQFLQVCKTGQFFKLIIAPRVVKFNMLMPVFTFFAEKHDIVELNNTL